MLCLITILLAMMGGIREFLINLPFKTMEHPTESIYDEGAHYFNLDFTVDPSHFAEDPTEEQLEALVVEGLGEASFMYLALMYSPDMHSGFIELNIPASPTPDDRNFTILYNQGRSGFYFSQDGLVPEPAVLSASPSAPLFPSLSDTRTLTMTNGIEGVRYSLYRDDELICTKTFTGSSVSFGTVSQPGVYRVYRPEGYSVCGLVLRLHDVFVPGKFMTTGMAATALPADGGTASVTFSLARDIPQEDADLLEDWFNTKQNNVSFWQTLGQKMSISRGDDGRYTVSLTCPPNLSSASRTFDTGMYLSPDGQTTLSFQQPGGGELLDYDLDGTATSDAGLFNITLSGSQPGVTYRLTLKGETVRTATGTGEPIVFRNLSRSGEYSVTAEYSYHTRTMSGTFAASIPDEPGGANYVAQETYVGNGTSPSPTSPTTAVSDTPCRK